MSKVEAFLELASRRTKKPREDVCGSKFKNVGFICGLWIYTVAIPCPFLSIKNRHVCRKVVDTVAIKSLCEP